MFLKSMTDRISEFRIALNQTQAELMEYIRDTNDHVKASNDFMIMKKWYHKMRMIEHQIDAYRRNWRQTEFYSDVESIGSDDDME
jgi:hypothetical protein